MQTILVGLAMLLVRPAFGEHPDLSGSWQLDIQASAFGSMAIPNSGLLTISAGPHKMLHMQLVLNGPQSERTFDNDWKVDDRYHPVVGDQSGTVLAKWDGTVLLGKRHTEAGMEEFRLIPNSGGLTMTETIQSSQGSTTLIWRRISFTAP